MRLTQLDVFLAALKLNAHVVVACLAASPRKRYDTEFAVGGLEESRAVADRLGFDDFNQSFGFKMVQKVLLLAHLDDDEADLHSLIGERGSHYASLSHADVLLLELDVNPDGLDEGVLVGVVELLIFQPFLVFYAKGSLAWLHGLQVLELSELRGQRSADGQLVEVLGKVCKLHDEDAVINVVPLVDEALA